MVFIINQFSFRIGSVRPVDRQLRAGYERLPEVTLSDRDPCLFIGSRDLLRCFLSPCIRHSVSVRREFKREQLWIDGVSFRRKDFPHPVAIGYDLPVFHDLTHGQAADHGLPVHAGKPPDKNWQVKIRLSVCLQFKYGPVQRFPFRICLLNLQFPLRGDIRHPDDPYRFLRMVLDPHRPERGIISGTFQFHQPVNAFRQTLQRMRAQIPHAITFRDPSISTVLVGIDAILTAGPGRGQPLLFHNQFSIRAGPVQGKPRSRQFLTGQRRFRDHKAPFLILQTVPLDISGILRYDQTRLCAGISVRYLSFHQHERLADRQTIQSPHSVLRQIGRCSFADLRHIVEIKLIFKRKIPAPAGLFLFIDRNPQLFPAVHAEDHLRGSWEMIGTAAGRRRVDLRVGHVSGGVSDLSRVP